MPQRYYISRNPHTSYQKKLRRRHKKEDVHFTMKHPPSFIHSTQLILNYNRLVLRNKGLHDAPANEVGNGTDAEDYHVGGRLGLEAEEGEGSALLVGPGEEHTRTLVDEERAYTTCH